MTDIIDSIIEIIDSNEDLIHHSYKSKDDLICLSKKLTTKINNFLEKKLGDNPNKRDLIKKATKEAFSLHDSDIVFLNNGCIFVKLFDITKIRTISNAEKNTIANRFNGLSEEELKSFYDNFCNKKEIEKFFYHIAKQFVDMYLLDKKINNETYEKYVFQLIQSIINTHLINIYDRNDVFFTGFSGYIFRIHFKEVFSYIAQLILFEISMSNKHMIEFIKYYSLNIVVVDGKKYKVPEIKAESGLLWNVVSMMSIVKIYNKAALSIDEFEYKKDALRKKIDEFYIGDLSPIEHNNEINKEIQLTSQEYSYLLKKQDSINDLIAISKNESDKNSLKAEMNEIKEELSNLADRKNKLSAKLLGTSSLTKYNDIKKDIDSLSRHQRRDEKILEQNKDAYLSIKNALIKALTSKKIPIEG